MPSAFLVPPTRKKMTRRAPDIWLQDGTLGNDFFAYMNVPLTYSDQPALLRKYKQIYIDASSKFCLDGQGIAIAESLPRHPDTRRVAAQVDSIREAIAAGRVTPHDTPGPLALLATSYHANYYHFLCDDLGRLGFYEAVESLRRARFPVPSPTPWQQEFYRLAGIEDRQLLLPKGVSLLRKVWVAPRGQGRIAQLHSRAVDRVRVIADGVVADHDRSVGPRRIYVTREGTRHRRLLNEAQVQEVAVAAGFTVVRPELLSVVEQIRLFRDADVVLGTFGAGLTNAIFMRPGSHLLEIAPAKSAAHPAIHNAIFSTLAGICDLRYGLLSAPGEGVVAETNDFTAPADSVSALIEESLRPQRPLRPRPSAARASLRRCGQAETKKGAKKKRKH